MGGGPVAVAVLREPGAAAVRGVSGWGWSCARPGAGRWPCGSWGCHPPREARRDVGMGFGSAGWSGRAWRGVWGQHGGRGDRLSLQFAVHPALSPAASRAQDSPVGRSDASRTSGRTPHSGLPPAFSPPRDHPLHRPSSTFSQPPASLTAAAFLAMKVLHDTVSLAVLLR